MSSSEILIILNPAAGDKENPAAVEAWARVRPHVRLKQTRGPGDAHRWAREASTQGTRLIAAAGGDGTVNEVGSGIFEALGNPSGVGSGQGPDGSSLGIIPLGTGNDLARALEIPLDLQKALALLESRGRERDLDVLEVCLDDEAPRIVLNAVTGGFAGELHESLTDAVKEAWGPLSYLRTGVELWGDRSTWNVEVAASEGGGRFRALNLVMANGRSAGGGIPVAPGADPGDGRMDVLIITDAEPMELSGLAARMLAGTTPEHDALTRLRTRKVEVRSSLPLPLSLDGEPARASRVRAEIHPAALRVRVHR